MQATQTNRIGTATFSLPGLGVTGPDRVAKLRILYAGPLAILAAVAANLVARAAAVAVLPPLNPAFVEMQPQAIVFVTSVLCAAAVAVFALVAFISRRPLRTYAVASVGALVLSWVPDLMILSQPGATIGGVIALMVMHAIAAAAVFYTLAALTRKA